MEKDESKIWIQFACAAITVNDLKDWGDGRPYAQKIVLSAQSASDQADAMMFEYRKRFGEKK